MRIGLWCAALMFGLATSANGQTPPDEQSSPTESDQAPKSIEDGGDLNLLCMGGGSANKITSGSMYAWNNHGDSANATVTGRRSQGFQDQVSLRLQGSSDGRVRMPRTMLTPIRGGEDGWFKLKEIEIKPHEITASVAVNVFNNPKLRLDRYTGAISISGKAGDYTGQCQSYDPDKMERKF